MPGARQGRRPPKTGERGLFWSRSHQPGPGAWLGRIGEMEETMHMVGLLGFFLHLPGSGGIPRRAE